MLDAEHLRILLQGFVDEEQRQAAVGCGYIFAICPVLNVTLTCGGVAETAGVVEAALLEGEGTVLGLMPPCSISTYSLAGEGELKMK